jgi:hypothetical protein
MRKSLKERIKGLPTLDMMIGKDLKNPGFAKAYRRAQMRVSIVRATETKAGKYEGKKYETGVRFFRRGTR